MARLGDVVKISPSTAPQTGEQHWLLNLDMVEQQTGRIIAYNYVDADELDGSIIQFDTDAVLYSKLRPNLNKVVLPEQPGFATSEMLPLVPDTAVLTREYLTCFLRSDSFVTWAVSKTAGAKMPRLGSKELLGKEIPLPSIAEQDSIAQQFAKVDALITLRKQQIAKLDELVKARFVEMFGDPIENPMCWAPHPLDTVCNTIVDCPHSTPSYTIENTGFMCIRTSIVKKNKILWDEIEYIPEEEYNIRIQRKKPAKGDIVYTREGAILGIAAIIDRDCNVALGQRSMLLSPNPEKCCSEFLCVAMNFDSILRKALGGISGSASPHINVGDIKAFDIILPPLALQHQFAAFVAQTDQQKSTIQQSLAQLELLKKALMQKYFG